MRAIAVLLLTLTLSPPVSQAGSADHVTTELTQIEQQLATAWKSGDCGAWGGFIAPEWSVIHVTGDVITKQQALQMCRTPPAPIETLKMDEVLVLRVR